MPKRPGAGRKKATLDWDKIDTYLIGGATGVQVAASFGVHPDTLYRQVEEKYDKKFSDYAAEKRQKGNRMLHQSQFNQAMKGDRLMLIWLGKQRLEQRDKDKEQHKTGEDSVDLKLFRDMIRSMEKMEKENIELKKRLDELGIARMNESAIT